MIPMWLVGLMLGVAGAAGIVYIVWGERAALRRLKRKPKTRELVTRLGFDVSPQMESLYKAKEALRKMGQGMGHVNCRTHWEPTLVGPPAILCSACGDILERDGDHFVCIGCDRQVG